MSPRRKRRPETERACEGCGRAFVTRDDRYCPGCRKALLKELEDRGYLKPVPKMTPPNPDNVSYYGDNRGEPSPWQEIAVRAMED